MANPSDVRPLAPSLLPPKLKVGFNYPWAKDDYGTWIGPNPGDLKETVPRWKTSRPRNLRTLKQLGVEVVRVFLMGNGVTYGANPHFKPVPASRGNPRFGSYSDWHFDPDDPGVNVRGFQFQSDCGDLAHPATSADRQIDARTRNCLWRLQRLCR
jgi:hypothetical protein